MIRLCSWRLVSVALAAPLCLALVALGQGPPRTTAFTWRQIKDRFEAVNPTLIAARANIDESKASEITAFLRPNPDFSLSTDGFQLTPNLGIWRPVSGVVLTEGISYLHERQHKRELRLESAKKSTDIAQSTFADQERGLLYNLRNAFVQVLQAKAVLGNANENLGYWDRELAVNRNRYAAGDLAQLDLNKLELQRAQFEEDEQTAILNLKTSKIQIQQLVLDRTPLEGFDLAGPYEYAEKLDPLESFRTTALETRPDLKTAIHNVELARTNHQLAIANGSTDPTWSVWYSRNASFANPFANNTAGFSFDIPLRINDRNQGEKARTQIDIGRNEKLEAAAEAQVYSDVDSAYASLQQALNLLGRYKTRYLPLASDVRDHTRDAFDHGGATLLDYLDSEKSYRDANLSYLNFIGSYLTAAAQMNMAVGREVIP
jgi:cobalt-zinc-cadmium efflux system outer membrane protein